MPSATRKNSPGKKNLTATQKRQIQNSLARFNRARESLNSMHRRFNPGTAPSDKAMLAALKALAGQRGGTRRRRRS